MSSLAGDDERPEAEEIKFRLAHLAALHGNGDAGPEHLSVCGSWSESDDVQDRAMYASADAAVLLTEGDSKRALETARRAIEEALTGLGVANEVVRLAFPIAVEAAIDIGDVAEDDWLADLLATRPRGEVPSFLRAEVIRAKALTAAARGEGESVEENLVAAEAAFRDLGYPYWMARAQLDRAERLARQGRLDESARLVGEAAVTFDRIGVTTMLSRARALLEPGAMRKPGAGGALAVARSGPSLAE